MANDANATVLAFDFGTRRIGVAVGNTLTRNARALQTIDGARTEHRAAAIAALVGEWEPARLVVGLPVHADGTEHAMTARAREFARELERRHRLPVTLVDERFTSEIARSEIAAAGGGARADRGMRDRVAARIILQAWLDERHDL